MKKWTVLLILLSVTCISFAQTKNPPTQLKTLSDDTMIIDDFEMDTIGELPGRWYEQRAEKKPINYPQDLKDTYNYEVMEERGNKFLRFDGVRGKHLNFPLLKIEGLDLNKTPVLKWDWRAHKLPVGGNENSKTLNDVTASIYVVFDMGRVALVKKVPKSIRYTWSSTLPEGTEISAFFGNQKIVVVESGENETGKWKTFERNIVEDYKRLFGDSPPDVPIALLILSDGDDTGDRVMADYDNIKLSIDQ